MEFQYTRTKQGIRLDHISDPDPTVIIPEEIDGLPVTELGAYVLAESQVEELSLPPALVKIGAYAFYNCEHLKQMTCYSRISDLGTGMFAGGKGAELLDFTQSEGETSYFKDILSELHQTLRVRLHGVHEARLIFPEYFEEAVENTPARILVIETHGCGHRYRYCFDNREFQYRSYDALFPHVQVQEREELVTELALGRLLYPHGLTEEHRQMYQAYVREHWRTAGRLIVETDCRYENACTNLDRGCMPWFVEHYIENISQIQYLIAQAQRAGATELVSWLMNHRHEQSGMYGDGTRRGYANDGGISKTGQEPTLKKPRRFEL